MAVARGRIGVGSKPNVYRHLIWILDSSALFQSFFRKLGFRESLVVGLLSEFTLCWCGERVVFLLLMFDIRGRIGPSKIQGVFSILAVLI